MIDKKYLPSKKFTKIAVTSVATLVIVYFIFLYSKTYITLKNPEITTISVPVQELLEKDTDGDGVRDWEEILWGTDINLPATFNTPDKTYVDNKKKEIASNNKTETDSVEKLNDTEKIAREFLATVLTLKESGNLNTSNITNLAKKFSGDIGNQASLLEKYVMADIKQGPDTAVAKKTYYDKLTKAMATAKSNGMGDELQTIASFFSNDNQNNASLIKIASTYSTLTKTLSTMQVPASAVELHLALLNESENMSMIFKNITEINDNSIVGLIAISQFEINEPKLEKTIASFITYFKSNGIIR